MSPRERFGYFAIIAIVLFAFGTMGSRYLDKPAPIIFEQPGQIKSLGQGTSIAPQTMGAPAITEVVVHVAGAVKKPGVFKFAPGERVQDAIDRAGGTVNADLEGINLAAKLEDGSQLFVPRKGADQPAQIERVAEAYSPTRTSAAYHSKPAKTTSTKPREPAPASISLNTASASELDRLPGVGPATAAKILEYRKSRGGFTSIDEVLAVKGIGPKKLAAMRKFLKL